MQFETKLNYEKFDYYKQEAFKVYRIYFDKLNWRNSECNCFNFLKNYKCPYVLGIAIRLKVVDPPAAAKSVPIGKKEDQEDLNYVNVE